MYGSRTNGSGVYTKNLMRAPVAGGQEARCKSLIGQGYGGQKRSSGPLGEAIMNTGKQRRLVTRAAIQKIKLIVWAMAVLFALYFLSFNDYGLVQHFRMRRELQRIQSQIDLLKRQQAEIQLTIQKLLEDDAFIEKIAREKYQFVRKGEEVFILKAVPPDSLH
jgi:cell division protein FtsB